MSCSLQLICPDCGTEFGEGGRCKRCGNTYSWLKGGRLISVQVDCDAFYQQCYESQWKKKRYLNLTFADKLFSIPERTSLFTRRERFYRSHIDRRDKPVILDVACDYGRKLFVEYGTVAGLDVVLEPLYSTCELYDLCVHADAFSIPFPSEYFDHIVSSDFLGHIPVEK